MVQSLLLLPSSKKTARDTSLTVQEVYIVVEEGDRSCYFPCMLFPRIFHSTAFNIDIGQTTWHFSWSIRLNLVEVTCLPQKAISLQFVLRSSFKGPFPRHISNDQSSLIRHKAYQSCKSIENHKVPSMNSVPGQKWKETWKQFGSLQLAAQHFREDEK